MKLIKLMKSNLKGKEKRYPCTDLGYVRMLWDMKQEKIGKINGYFGLVVIVGLFAFGILSKEIFIVLLANKGIGKVTTLFMG